MKHDNSSNLKLSKVLLAGALCLSARAPVFALDRSEASSGEGTQLAKITALYEKKWIHGSADCEQNADPKIDVFRYDATSYVLRQNKCQTFEAPFIYVLIGEEKVLVLDSGAIASPSDSPLYETVQSLVNAHQHGDTENGKDIILLHSHNHNDHQAGDAQFEDMPNVTLVTLFNPKDSDPAGILDFADWPKGLTSLELGGRRLTVLPTPGHQEEAISIYDPQTKWLLTGDTLYPGKVYVKHWEDYRQSIARLVRFSEDHVINALLGAHIEMSSEPGKLYSIGSTYQPNEAPLALGVSHLTAVHSALQKSTTPHEILLGEVVVVPMGVFRRALSNIVRWIVR